MPARNKPSQKSKQLTFNHLIESICSVHKQFLTQAVKAVNTSLTLRNWFIGRYIAEFELHGKDRAKYGQRLIDELTIRLTENKVNTCGRRQLYEYMTFYKIYPQIVRSVTAQSSPTKELILKGGEKVRTVSAQLSSSENQLVEQFSYSHFAEFLEIEDPRKRAFYERECIRGHWSVRELKRQISTLYFERCGLSKNKKKLATITSRTEQKDKPEFSFREPYVFEFLGIKSKEVMGESQLEDALVDKLQEFLLELGHGFCFEARQQRIIIGGEYCFVDLVFYHRVLKCHVLVELKTDEFKYDHVGQLNTYVNWYRKHVMTATDNPPVGILLCTRKNDAKVEFALAGMDNKLFIRKYQLELPKKEEIKRFIEKELS